MGISQSTLAMENGPERDERMEEVPAPEAEQNSEEPATGLVPSEGTLELQQGGAAEVPTSRRHTEVLELPPVYRGSAPATPAIRPGESSTPATGTKSRAERKQEKKTARKEEKRNRKAEKSARKAEQAEEEKPEGTQFEGSWMLPWRPQAVLNRYFYSKGSIKHFSETHRTSRTSTSLSIGLSRTSDTSPVQYSAPRQGKKKGLSLRSFGKKEKLRMLKLPSVQQQEWKKQMKVLPQGNVSLKNWKRRNVLWRKRMIESERSSRKNLEDSRLSRKPNVEPGSNVRGTPKYKYRSPARRRKEKPGSSGKLRSWWRTTSSRMARSRRSQRKPQKLTPQHVRTPSRPRKTSYLHFRKLRKRLKYCRDAWEEPWKLQWLSAAKRSVPSSTLRPKTSVRAQKYRELKPDLRSLLDFKKGSGRKKVSKKRPVNLGRMKDLKYQRQPSQDRSGESVLESNRLKKNQERNGEKRFLKMYGRLEDCSRKMKGTWSVPTTRSRLNGRRSCEKSYSLWRAVGLVKEKMERCTRREDLDGNFVRPENSKVSTSPWSGTMESGWYGKARKLKEDRKRSTTSIVTLLEGERWRKLRSSGSSTQY